MYVCVELYVCVLCIYVCKYVYMYVRSEDMVWGRARNAHMTSLVMCG
jgi:hypothetical protein